MPNGDEQGTAESSRPTPPSGRFTGFVGFTALANIVTIVCGFLGSLLVAYALGPEGKGALQFLITIPGTVFAATNLGFGTAIMYRISRGLAPARAAVGFGLVAGAVLGTLGVLGTFLVLGPGHPIWGNVALWGILVAGALTPLLFLHKFLGGALSGTFQIHYQSLSLIIHQVGILLFLLVFLVLVPMGVSGGALAHVLALGAATALQFGVLWRLVGVSFHFDRRLLLGSLGYGILNYLMLLSNQLVYRVDIFFVKAWQGDAQLGLYSVAASMAQIFWLLPYATSAVLFPFAATGNGGRESRSLRLCRLQMALSLLGAPVLAGLIPLVIYLYPARFSAAIWPSYALLPGVLLMPIFKYLATDLAAHGNQRVPLLISVIGLTVDVGLVILLVPRAAWYGGIVGAGLASTVAYSLMALASAAYYRWTGRAALRDILVPAAADFRYLYRFPGRLWQRLRQRTSRDR